MKLQVYASIFVAILLIISLPSYSQEIDFNQKLAEMGLDISADDLFNELASFKDLDYQESVKAIEERGVTVVEIPRVNDKKASREEFEKFIKAQQLTLDVNDISTWPEEVLNSIEGARYFYAVDTDFPMSSNPKMEGTYYKGGDFRINQKSELVSRPLMDRAIIIIREGGNKDVLLHEYTHSLLRTHETTSRDARIGKMLALEKKVTQLKGEIEIIQESEKDQTYTKMTEFIELNRELAAHVAQLKFSLSKEEMFISAYFLTHARKFGIDNPHNQKMHRNYWLPVVGEMKSVLRYVHLKVRSDTILLVTSVNKFLTDRDRFELMKIIDAHNSNMDYLLPPSSIKFLIEIEAALHKLSAPPQEEKH